MSTEQKDWLHCALKAMNPVAHKWLERNDIWSVV